MTVFTVTCDIWLTQEYQTALIMNKQHFIQFLCEYEQ